MSCEAMVGSQSLRVQEHQLLLRGLKDSFLAEFNIKFKILVSCKTVKETHLVSTENLEMRVS